MVAFSFVVTPLRRVDPLAKPAPKDEAVGTESDIAAGTVMPLLDRAEDATSAALERKLAPENHDELEAEAVAAGLRFGVGGAPWTSQSSNSSLDTKPVPIGVGGTTISLHSADPLPQGRDLGVGARQWGLRKLIRGPLSFCHKAEDPLCCVVGRLLFSASARRVWSTVASGADTDRRTPRAVH